MEYFVHCRDKPGTSALRRELTEAHWSFMDGYADSLIARGPTLNAEETMATGSIHIVDLPDLQAANTFAYDEPNFRAGVYGDVAIRRWHNSLGRTMWEFEGGSRTDQRFLIIGYAREGAEAGSDGVRPDRDAADHRDRLIAWGPLFSADGSTWVGSVTLAELADDVSIDAVLASDPYARAGLYGEVEVHKWRFGGRPAA